MKKRFFLFLLTSATSLGILGICAAFGIYIWGSQDLPSITTVADYRPPQVTTVYARDNSIIGYFFREKRFLANLDQMPQHLKMAFLAAEDAAFYKHQGVNPKAILRSFIHNIMSGKATKGGSTITQQVVKRLLLTPERKLKRKVKEAILAYRLEKYLTKDEILYIYLNQIYLGNSAYGVEAAARTYFGKNCSQLTIAESAVIAGLPQAPSYSNPYNNPEATRSRQLYVLNRMLDEKFISHDQYNQAVNEQLNYKQMPDPSWKLGAWYLEEVRRQLITFLSQENITRLGLKLDQYGETALYEAGLNVYTAMDPAQQAAAEISLRTGLDNAYRRSGWHGPIQHLSVEEYPKFIKNNPFTPEDLVNAGWAKAIVTKVTKEGAEVKLGNYTGYVPVSTMGWCRKPNLRVSPEGAGTQKDATHVLAPGDVIWVSAYGASGTTNPVGFPAQPDDKKNPIPEYKAEKVTPLTVIKLSLEQESKLQGAIASIETETGDLTTIVGGYAFSTNSQFNRATQAYRQPGSSFKPLIYSTALDHGFTAGSMLLDSPFVYVDPWTKKVWKPRNFDSKFLGPILFRTALTKSRNLCTVRLAESVGMAAIIQRCHDLGIQGNIPAVLPVSLGSYEVTPLGMAEAYTAFANQGVYIKPRSIISIANCWQEDLVRFNPDRRQALSPQNAYIMASLLRDVVTAGTGSRARALGRPVAGKTGTSNEERDAWFIGFSPYLVTSIYVGYDDHSPMGRLETGGRAAVPIFVDYRQQIDKRYDASDFSVPPGITFVSVNPETGLPGGGLSLPFISGTESTLGINPMLNEDDNSREVELGEDLMKQMF